MNFTIYREPKDRVQIVDQDALGEVVAEMDCDLPDRRKLRLAMLLAASPKLVAVCREILRDPACVMSDDQRRRLQAALLSAGQECTLPSNAYGWA